MCNLAYISDPGRSQCRKAFPGYPCCKEFFYKNPHMNNTIYSGDLFSKNKLLLLLLFFENFWNGGMAEWRGTRGFWGKKSEWLPPVRTFLFLGQKRRIFFRETNFGWKIWVKMGGGVTPIFYPKTPVSPAIPPFRRSKNFQKIIPQKKNFFAKKTNPPFLT